MKRWTVPNWVLGMARGAADFVYPPACRLCNAELPPTVAVPRGSPFCDACRKNLLMTRGPACIRCGSSIGPYLDPQAPCSMCRDERFAFERVVRLGVYDEGAADRLPAQQRPRRRTTGGGNGRTGLGM